MQSAWPVGWASAQATTRALASAKPGASARATPGSEGCCASIAQAAARTRCALKAKFDALSIRKGHKKSVVALAHKMLRTIYAMLSNASHYQDKEVDYEALNVQRNAPRWIKMLRKHGFIATPAAA